jgi:ribosomal peptide maturation radical SAM protein 1
MSSKKDLVLVAMPWPSLNRTPIQLGLLRPVAERAGFSVGTRSYFISAVEHFVAHTAHLPPRERITVGDYNTVIHRWKSGIGDWIFAVPPYQDHDADREREFFVHLRAKGVAEEFIAKVVRMRELVPAFLAECLEDILSESPRVVGFTTTFSQNVPSLVLSKMLKERAPHVQVVFGGANCDGPMGAALHRAFPWVDMVVRGEGEHALPELLRNVLSGEPVRPLPGLCYREGERAFVVPQEGGRPVVMDEVPAPDYDEYFARLRRSRLHDELSPKVEVLYESARGCWWGEVHHCTFCGMNGSTMKFRSKSPRRAADEVYELSAKYRRLDFEAVDNIIDMQYQKEFLPRMREYRRAGLNFKLFYETKSNLKKEQLRLMRDAGLRHIQPGIESLSSIVLKLMRKGVTGLQNIRLLKWARQFGMDVNWNILYGFPGEPRREYERMAEVIPSVVHLQPPAYTSVLVVERFSPYHQTPGAFGLVNVRPAPYYKFVYPVDEGTLNDLAYDFLHEYADGSDPADHFAIIEPAVRAWREVSGHASLTYRRGPGFLNIYDRRPNLGAKDYYLESTEAQIYLLCDAGMTPGGVWRALPARDRDAIGPGQVKEFMDALVAARLAYEEDGRYLSLALPENPDAAGAEAERADDETLARLVQITTASHAGSTA